MKRATLSKESLAQRLGRYAHPAPEVMEQDVELVWRRVRAERQAPADFLADAVAPAPVRGTRHGRRFLTAAAAIVLVVGLSSLLRPTGTIAVVEASDSGLYRLVAGQVQPLKIGETVAAGQTIRSEGASSATLAFHDGSHFEMRSMSEVALDDAQGGIRIRLSGGSVIVSAKKPGRNLYVQTNDATVVVSGGVTMVTVEQTYSRVAVIQGEAFVEQTGTLNWLLPGEQVATDRNNNSRPVTQDIAWSRHATEHLALLQNATGAAAGQNRSEAEATLFFEVASIRPNVSGMRGGSFDMTGGNQLVIRNYSLRDIIASAYSVRSTELLNAPGWTLNERFDITAKPPDGVPRDKKMLQQLLEDRFKLRAHFETRQIPIYALVIARSDRRLGPQLRPSTIDCVAIRAARARGETVPRPDPDAPFCSASTTFGRIRISGYAMADVARNLSTFTGRPVIDRTDLTGTYDIDLSWTPEVAPPGIPFDPTGPSVLIAIQDQLGLKFESGTDTANVLVIDSVDRPTPN